MRIILTAVTFAFSKDETSYEMLSVCIAFFMEKLIIQAMVTWKGLGTWIVVWGVKACRATKEIAVNFYKTVLEGKA